MLLKMNNVGRLKSAEVKINGITVICGNNNTGKSTVGKILYCIYSSLHDLYEAIREDKIESIRRSIRYAMRSSEKSYYIASREILEYISRTLDNEITSKTLIDTVIKLCGIDKTELDKAELSARIDSILATSTDDMVCNFIARRIDSEFGQGLGNVNHPRSKVSIELTIKNEAIKFCSSGSSEKLVAEKFFSLDKNIIYIDDPFIIDELNSYIYLTARDSKYGHRYNMLNMIAGIYREKRTSAEEIIASHKLEQVIESINSVSDGDLVREGREFMYKHSRLKKSLNLHSVSTGIKTFIIIKKLLLDGILEENGIIVLDEPEVHLHPEWQIKFAEIIVLLQKAYGLNVILTTHSMDFLSAIDYFSQKNGIEEVCSYYLTELKEAKKPDDFPYAVMSEMTSDKEKLYASISEPFLSLYKQMND